MLNVMNSVVYVVDLRIVSNFCSRLAVYFDDFYVV
jgi:hypothetical protein